MGNFGLAPSETSSTYHEVRLGSFPRRAPKLAANKTLPQSVDLSSNHNPSEFLVVSEGFYDYSEMTSSVGAVVLVALPTRQVSGRAR